MTVSIVSPSAAAVKPRRHPRFRREDIPAPEIDPVLKPGAWCTHPRHEKHGLRAGAPHTRTETRF